MPDATEPPSEPAPPPPLPENPFGHLEEPQLELPTRPPTFAPFESAVDDATPTSRREPPPLADEPAPDVSAPWGAGAATSAGADAPAIGTRPRRSQLGMMLFIGLVFLPLALYAVLATILAIKFYLERGTSTGGGDPRQYLPDVEGDHPGFKKSGKQSFVIPDSYSTDPLPASLRVPLGQTLAIGDLEVQPTHVDWRKVSVRVGDTKPAPTVHPALILHLTLRNTSPEIAFYPLDPFFNRQWNRVGGGPRPLTLLEAGSARYYGGSAEWNGVRHETVEGSNVDRPLEPGESGDYFVCTNGYEDEAKKLAKYSGPLLWRVQLRRGLVRYRDKDLSATAVIGVEFKDADIDRSDPQN